MEAIQPAINEFKPKPTNMMATLAKAISPNTFKNKEDAEKFLLTPEAKDMVMKRLRKDCYVVHYPKSVERMVNEQKERQKMSKQDRILNASLKISFSALSLGLAGLKDCWNKKYNELRETYQNYRNKLPHLFKDKKVEAHFEKQMGAVLNSLSYITYKECSVIIFAFGTVIIKLRGVRNTMGWRSEDEFVVEYKVNFLKTKKRPVRINFSCGNIATGKWLQGSGTMESGLKEFKKALDWEDNRIHKNAQVILAYIEDFGYYGKLYIHSEKKISQPVADFCKQLHWDMIRVGNCNNWKKKEIKNRIGLAEAVLSNLQNPEQDDKAWMEHIISNLKLWYTNYSKK